jgi:hypothetical protein
MRDILCKYSGLIWTVRRLSYKNHSITTNGISVKACVLHNIKVFMYF